MQEILNGMTEMALERLLWQIVDAEVDAACVAEEHHDPVSAQAWRDAADAMQAMVVKVEGALLAQRAENERIAAM